MPYLSRDGQGSISGIFSQPQPGYAEELVDTAAPPLRRSDFEAAIEQHLDNVARQRGYHSPASV
ncbi:MAG TPA: hypothetical protein VMF90_21865 [Rhizobiaceae bacterium]|nr:hypothetical protein [Rhizobiaceae bacterium]